MLPLPPRYGPHADELGQGGFGTVYRTRDQQLGIDVAVKIPYRGADADLSREVAAELQAAAGLRHPAIVQVLDAGVSRDGRPFLVMEYAPEGSMTRLMKAPPPWSELLALLLQVLDGLGYAHASRLIHRDVKMDNVLLARGADGRLHAKLADFGLAKVMQRRGGYESSRLGAGTIMFMPPEQFDRDTSSIHPGADLYAFGVMLYMLVAGHPPWRAENELNLMFSKVTGKPELLQIRAGYDAPTGLQPIVEHLLAPRPADRYELAADVIRDLRALHEVGSPLPVGRLFASGDGGSMWLAAQSALPDGAPDPERPPPFPPTAAIAVVRPPRFVGRDLERSALWKSARAAALDAAAIAICGDPGSGRSRLAEWVCGALERRGHARTFHVRIDAGDTPGEALGAAMRRFLFLGRLEGDDLRRRVGEWLQSRRHAAPEDQALLVRWLGAEGGPELDHGARLALLERVLGSESERGSIVLWVEDRAGLGATLAAEFLRMARAGRFSAFVLYEPPGGAVSALPEGFDRLDVGPLSQAEVLGLAEDLLPDGALAAEIARLARGSPRMAVEAARLEAQRRSSWLVEGAPDLPEAARPSPHDGATAHTVVPTLDLDKVVGERLDAFLRGGADNRAELLFFCLVALPRPCPAALLQAAADRVAGIPAPALRALLDGARAAGLLKVELDGAVDVPSAPLLQGAKERLDAHPDAARIRAGCAEALLDGAREADPRRVRAARLLLDAGQPSEALRRFQEVGERLLANDLDAARQAWTGALDAAAALGLGPEDPRRLQASLGLARAARNAGDLDAAADIVAGLPVEGLDAGGRAQILETRASVALLRGELPAALDAAGRARAALGSETDQGLLPRVLLILGEAQHRSGDRALARQSFSEAVRVGESRGAVVEQADAMIRLAKVDRAEKRADAAREGLERALALARTMGDARLEGLARRDLGNLLLWARRPAEAAEHLQAALALLERAGYRPEAAVTRNSLGEVARGQGRLADARKDYSAALAVARAFRLSATSLVALINLASVEIGLGQASRIAFRLQELDDLLPPGTAHAYRPYIEGIRLVVRATQQDWAGAEAVLSTLMATPKAGQDADLAFFLEQCADASRTHTDTLLAEDAYGFALRIGEALGDKVAVERIRGKLLALSS